MVGLLKSYNDIDLVLRDSLFDKRGYGITVKDFEKKLDDIFRGKDENIAIQCKCGDLVILNKDVYKSISGTIRNHEWCKRCRLMPTHGIDFSINIRTAKIEKLMDDFEFDYEHKIINCPLYKFREIKKLGDGLFPANNVFEFLYGYGFFGRDWLRNLAGIITIDFHERYNKTIDALVKDIYKRNQSDTLKLLDLISHDRMESINTHEKIDNINRIIERDFKSEKTGIDSTDEDIKIGHDEAWALLAINSYNQAFEVQAILDLLKNIENILCGKTILEKPYVGVKIITPSGEKKVGDSKAYQVEYLIKSKLPQDLRTILSKIYDNHLRNALFHNQLKVHVSFKKVELTKYNEIRTFEEISFLKKLFLIFRQFYLALYKN